MLNAELPIIHVLQLSYTIGAHAMPCYVWSSVAMPGLWAWHVLLRVINCAGPTSPWFVQL
jgi:hypothetical protein